MICWRESCCAESAGLLQTVVAAARASKPPGAGRDNAPAFVTARVSGRAAPSRCSGRRDGCQFVTQVFGLVLQVLELALLHLRFQMVSAGVFVRLLAL